MHAPSTQQLGRSFVDDGRIAPRRLKFSCRTSDTEPCSSGAYSVLQRRHKHTWLRRRWQQQSAVARSQLPPSPLLLLLLLLAKCQQASACIHVADVTSELPTRSPPATAPSPRSPSTATRNSPHRLCIRTTSCPSVSVALSSRLAVCLPFCVCRRIKAAVWCFKTSINIYWFIACGLMHRDYWMTGGQRSRMTFFHVDALWNMQNM